MSVTEIVEHLSDLSDADRLVVINAASSLMTDCHDKGKTNVERRARLAAAAVALKDHYENNDEVKDWQSLDAEEIHDDHLAG
jgi:hypothetical protein